MVEQAEKLILAEHGALSTAILTALTGALMENGQKMKLIMKEHDAKVTTLESQVEEQNGIITEQEQQLQSLIVKVKELETSKERLHSAQRDSQATITRLSQKNKDLNAKCDKYKAASFDMVKKQEAAYGDMVKKQEAELRKAASIFSPPKPHSDVDATKSEEVPSDGIEKSEDDKAAKEGDLDESGDGKNPPEDEPSAVLDDDVQVDEGGEDQLANATPKVDKSASMLHDAEAGSPPKADAPYTPSSALQNVPAAVDTSASPTASESSPSPSSSHSDASQFNLQDVAAEAPKTETVATPQGENDDEEDSAATPQGENDDEEDSADENEEVTTGGSTPEDDREVEEEKDDKYDSAPGSPPSQEDIKMADASFQVGGQDDEEDGEGKNEDEDSFELHVKKDAEGLSEYEDSIDYVDDEEEPEKEDAETMATVPKKKSKEEQLAAAQEWHANRTITANGETGDDSNEEDEDDFNEDALAEKASPKKNKRVSKRTTPTPSPIVTRTRSSNSAIKKSRLSDITLAM